MTPRLRFKENNEPYIDGEFEFRVIDRVILENDLTTSIELVFKWNPETKVDISAFSNDVYNELIAEKLKKDFLKFLNNN